MQSAALIQGAIASRINFSRLIISSLLGPAFIAILYPSLSNAWQLDIRQLEANAQNKGCETCQTDSNKICCPI